MEQAFKIGTESLLKDPQSPITILLPSLVSKTQGCCVGERKEVGGS